MESLCRSRRHVDTARATTSDPACTAASRSAGTPAPLLRVASCETIYRRVYRLRSTHQSEPRPLQASKNRISFHIVRSMFYAIPIPFLVRQSRSIHKESSLGDHGNGNCTAFRACWLLTQQSTCLVRCATTAVLPYDITR